MPSSYTEGKSETAGWLEEIAPKTATDVGPGCGTYAFLLNNRYPNVVYKGPTPKLTCIEAYYPYVTEYNLPYWYQNIIIADVRYVDWDKVPDSDVVIFGDILEHLTELEAVLVMSDVREVTKNVIISLPIIKFPQGAIGGNPFEIHKEEEWTHERMLKVFGTPHKYFNGTSIGTYWYKYD